MPIVLNHSPASLYMRQAQLAGRGDRIRAQQQYDTQELQNVLAGRRQYMQEVATEMEQALNQDRMKHDVRQQDEIERKNLRGEQLSEAQDQFMNQWRQEKMAQDKELGLGVEQGRMTRHQQTLGQGDRHFVGRQQLGYDQLQSTNLNQSLNRGQKAEQYAGTMGQRREEFGAMQSHRTATLDLQRGNQARQVSSDQWGRGMDAAKFAFDIRNQIVKENEARIKQTISVLQGMLGFQRNKANTPIFEALENLPQAESLPVPSIPTPYAQAAPAPDLLDYSTNTVYAVALTPDQKSVVLSDGAIMSREEAKRLGIKPKPTP